MVGDKNSRIFVGKLLQSSQTQVLISYLLFTENLAGYIPHFIAGETKV